MKRFYTYSNLLQTLCCICIFTFGIVEQNFAQKKNKSDVVTISIVVKTPDGFVYPGAKIWDLTDKNPGEANHLDDTNESGRATFKVLSKGTIAVGDYIIGGAYIHDVMDESENPQKLYTIVKVEDILKGKTEVIVQERVFPPTDAIGIQDTVSIHGKMRGNTMELSTKLLVNVDLVHTNNRFIWQPVIINQETKQIQYGRAFVLDGKEYSTTQLRNYDNNTKGGDPLYENGLVCISHDSLKLCRVKTQRRPVGKKEEIDYAKAHGYFTMRGVDTVYYKISNGDTIAFANRTDSIETYYYEFQTRDKIFVDQPLTPFAYVLELLSEDYEKILNRDLGDVHIYGVIHPLRLLDVKYQYAELDSALYKNWWPQAKVGNMATEGSVDLKFPVSESSLDVRDPHNAKELSKAQAVVSQIVGARGTKVTGMQVSGKSSPEGDYAKNLRLAEARLNTALRLLRSYIPADKRSDTWDKDEDILTPSVATWQEVADSMRNDGLLSEATEIEKIIAAHSTGRIERDMNTQGPLIRRLGFYNVIQEKYLPKFRRVDFVIDTYVNRSATIAEIRDAYANGEPMDEYSYHQLYANEPDTLLRYKYCQEAYEKFPKNIIFRTDHAGHLIAQNRPDTTLLSEYTLQMKRFKPAWKEGRYSIPEETRINQVISYVKMQNFDKAGKIAATHLSGNGRSEFAKCLARAFCGDLYDDKGNVNDTIVEVISKSSVMNEIIIRMAIDGAKEEEQRQRAQELCDTLLQKNKMDAMANFLKAICLKRKGNKGSKDWNQATIHLYRALEADPQLIELAKTDKDLYERLYDEEMPVPILRPKEDWEYELGLTK